MTSYADLCALIADDIDDTTGEYAQQIKRAVLAAVRYCERESYYFNEKRDLTFPTVNGQEFYDATDNPDIPSLITIQTAFSQDVAGKRTELRREKPADLEWLSDNSSSRGEPYCYSYFAQKIRLYPIPSAQVYTIRLQVGPYRLAPLANDDDTNAWLSEALDMIKARAKYILAKDTLKDANVAAEALNDYQDQQLALSAETSRRKATGRIVATSF